MIILYVLKALMGLRVSEEEELEGLDVVEHGEVAYQGLSGSSYVFGYPLIPMSEEKAEAVGKAILREEGRT
jgi:hypothetical protein